MALSETLHPEWMEITGVCNYLIILFKLLLYSFLAKPESLYYCQKDGDSGAPGI
jgi:hypothetical protein